MTFPISTPWTVASGVQSAAAGRCDLTRAALGGTAALPGLPQLSRTNFKQSLRGD